MNKKAIVFLIAVEIALLTVVSVVRDNDIKVENQNYIGSDRQ